MKKTVIVLILLVVVSSGMLFSAEAVNKISVGVITGSPFLFGVTGEYNFGEISAIAAMAYAQNSFLLRFGADYHIGTPVVWGDLKFIPSIGGQLDLFVSIATFVGLGVPVTLSYFLDDIPLKVSLKIGPELLIGGSLFDFDLLASVSGLYMF